MQYFRFGLSGYPLGHSLSPVLHQAFLQACSLTGEYCLYPVAPEVGQAALAGLLQRVRTGELHGLNVTIPYKQAVIPLLDELTPTARIAGAVNTILPQDGKLWGENTDVPGFLADLARMGWAVAPNAGALVLGAGGAARAVCLALTQAGWQVQVAARRPEQAQALAARLQTLSPVSESQIIAAPYPTASTRLEPGLALIVNATPLGMFPAVAASPWPAGLALPAGAAVYDLVYNPGETALLKAARQAGLAAAGGLGMLVEQAALAFEAWTGQKPSTGPARVAAEQILNLPRNETE